MIIKYIKIDFLILAILISACSASPAVQPSGMSPMATLPAKPATTITIASMQPTNPITITPTPLAVELVNSITGESVPLNLPVDIAFDEPGNFYVVDSANQRILKYDRNLSLLTKWGGAGTGEGKFNFMDGVDGYGGVATDPQGNVFVADTHNSRVQKFSSEGLFLLQWGSKGTGDSQFLAPLGIIVDQHGDVYVSDYERNDIQKFDSSGGFLLKYGDAGAGDGQFNQPSYLAVDSLDNIFVADTYNDRVQKFDKEGHFLAMWGRTGVKDGEFNRPYGVAVDHQNNVYVTEYKGNRVQKFDSTGRFLLKWGTFRIPEMRLRAPSGLKVSPDGNIYVADYGNNRIQVFRETTP